MTEEADSVKAVTNKERLALPTINDCLIQAGWGIRPTEPDQVVTPLRATLALLDRVGGALCGPWGYGEGDSFETARVVDVTEMDDSRLCQLVGESLDPRYPSSGFSRSLTRGAVITPQGWASRNRAVLTFRFGSRVGDLISISGDRQMGPAVTMRKHAVELVEGLAQIWNAAFVSFRDRALGDLEGAFWKEHGGWDGHQWPMWGYVSLMTGHVARNLDVATPWASVTPRGTGWLVQTNSQVPQDAAHMWKCLYEHGCLRHAPGWQEPESEIPGLVEAAG